MKKLNISSAIHNDIDNHNKENAKIQINKQLTR